MSIRNDRTGRHEDDLMAHAYQQGGQVDVNELIAHLRECVVGCGFGANVEKPVEAACNTLEKLLRDTGRNESAYGFWIDLA